MPQRPQDLSAVAELRRNWLLLLAAVSASGIYATTYYTIGVFVAPWQAEFGWRKSEIGVAFSIHALCLAVASPFVGGIIDRYGVRRPAFASLLCMSLGFIGLSTIGPERWTLYAAVAFFAFAGSATTPVVFTRSVIESFDRSRGLALGLTIGAASITATLAPIAAYNLINHVGWRGAWLAFAALPLVVIPFVYVGLKEVSNVRYIPTGVSAPVRPAEIGGIPLRSAVRSRTFWLLSLSFFMLTFAVTAALTQIVPMLSEIGVARAAAVRMASAMGLGLALGRVLGGYTVDRIFAARVFGAICLVAGIGLAALASGRSGLVFAACFSVGVAGGTEIDILAYMVSRYFGPMDYGKIYGLQWSFSLVGAMVSPIVAGHFLELRGGYRLLLTVSALLTFLAALLSLGFSPFPSFGQPASDEGHT
jgi:MFS family permease